MRQRSKADPTTDLILHSILLCVVVEPLVLMVSQSLPLASPALCHHLLKFYRRTPVVRVITQEVAGRTTYHLERRAHRKMMEEPSRVDTETAGVGSAQVAIDHALPLIVANDALMSAAPETRSHE
jgi:hypothetical protein